MNQDPSTIARKLTALLEASDTAGSTFEGKAVGRWTKAGPRVIELVFIDGERGCGTRITVRTGNGIELAVVDISASWTYTRRTVEATVAGLIRDFEVV